MPRRRRYNPRRYHDDDDEDGYYSYSHFPPKSVPRKVSGGIRAQSQRGTFGKSWWAQRWIKVLESFNIGSRLSRGRSYARNGQVLSVELNRGMVTAGVQGSRRDPYKVTIEVATLSRADGEKLGKELSAQPIFAAKLLASEMPQDVETAFTACGLSLFPESLGDLKTKCSCPDWSNPCKHVAAVYYLIGEEFDRDPFLIFRLRGLDRDRLIKIISESAGAQGDSEFDHEELFASDETRSEPITTDAARFWDGGDIPAGSSEMELPPVVAPLLKRLGSFPFWRSERRLVETLEPFYDRASRQALRVIAGDWRRK